MDINFQAISIALMIQIFVLVNPLSSVPVLMQAWKKKMNVKRIALTGSFVAFIIALSVALFGPFLFNFFGITTDSFRIAGGLVLLLLGLDTIRDKEEKTKVTKIDSLISIIATPLLTGPATISFITLKAFEFGRIPMAVNVISAFVFVGIVFYLFALAIPKINEKVVGIVSKILGLFLAGMAIEMIANGILNIIRA
jgi:multiple antibiotic resistance protein